jgi:ectoine hydroxylase-related dioxygenase (phytanoyl-CoA dioxygenase family)
MKLEPHPLNRNFQWQAAPPPYRRLTPEQVRAYDELGFFVLPEVFDAETVARVEAEIDPAEAEVEEALRVRPGGRLFIARAGEITFTVHLVARSRVLRDFVRGPVFQDLAHDLIGPDVRLYWDQAVYKKPGNPLEFPWHQDNAYTYVDPQQYVTCWVALSDATVENGCPWVVPGLHKLGTVQHELRDEGFACLDDPPDAVPAEVKAGGVVVFSSLTPHRTGPNLSDGVRKAYVVQIAADGARVLEPGSESSPRFHPCDAPERQFHILQNGHAVR